MKLILSALLLICLLNSCSNEKSDEYILPDSAELNSYFFFDPLFTEYLLEPPLKYGILWNDSILNKGKIFKIQITNKGMLSPLSITEEINYLFDRKGKFKEYSYFNFNFSDSIYTHILGEYNNENLISLKTQLFYGQTQNPEIKVAYLPDLIQYITINSNAKNDTLSVYLNNNSPFLIIDKFGDYVSKIHFIGESSNLSNSWLKKIKISKENWIDAEKILVLTENNLPQKAYHINENFIKTELYAEWQYHNEQKLSSYKRFISGNCVKDFTFDYSEDKIMRSFKMNRKLYEIQYN